MPGRERGLDGEARQHGGERGRRSPSRAARASPTLESAGACFPGYSGRPRRSRGTPSASWRRSSRSPPPRAACTAPRTARPSAPRCSPPTPRSSAPPCSSPGDAPDLLARLSGPGARRCRGPGTSTGDRARAPQAGPRRRRRAARLRHGRHEGRRSRSRSGRCARSPGGRRTTPRPRCCSCVTRKRRPRRSRTPSASRAGCVPVLRGGRADARGRRGRRRPAQGRRTITRPREGPRGALGLGARPRPQRAAGAGQPRPRRSPSRHAPDGPDHLTAVPTVLHAGDAFNVVPGPRRARRATCARTPTRRSSAVLDAIPADVGGVALQPELTRLWPGMDAERGDRAAARASGRGARPPGRGRAARRRERREPPRAPSIPLTVDGLGPRGGKAHNPGRVRARRVAREPRRGRARAGRRGAGVALAWRADQAPVVRQASCAP